MAGFLIEMCKEVAIHTMFQYWIPEHQSKQISQLAVKANSNISTDQFKFSFYQLLFLLITY
jgi:hypothetical protein